MRIATKFMAQAIGNKEVHTVADREQTVAHGSGSPSISSSCCYDGCCCSSSYHAKTCRQLVGLHAHESRIIFKVTFVPWFKLEIEI